MLKLLANSYVESHLVAQTKHDPCSSSSDLPPPFSPINKNGPAFFDALPVGG